MCSINDISNTDIHHGLVFCRACRKRLKDSLFCLLNCKCSVGLDGCILKVEPIRNLFASLFLASIGMLINVQFLWAHMDILLASLVLVITSKTIVVTVVVRAFGYSGKSAFLVSILLPVCI